MPNWVDNRITAPKSVIDQIWDDEEQRVDFNRIIPMPSHLDPDSPDYKTESGVMPGWYDWSVKNWGTKWNACDSERETDDSVRFNTAWAAPIPFIETLSKKFPKADIEVFWEEEQGFGEEYDIRNGERKGTISWDMPEYTEEDEEWDEENADKIAPIPS